MKNILNFEIKDIILAIVFALIGFFTTTKFVTIFIDKLGPVAGMIVTSIFLIGALVVLSLFDLIIFKFQYPGFIRAVGMLLITFSFFIVTSQSSCYQNLTIDGNCNVSSSYFQSPDGAVWHIASSVIHPIGPDGIVPWKLQTTRIVTYVAVPGVLTLLGGLLLKGEPEMAM